MVRNINREIILIHEFSELLSLTRNETSHLSSFSRIVKEFFYERNDEKGYELIESEFSSEEIEKIGVLKDKAKSLHDKLARYIKQNYGFKD